LNAVAAVVGLSMGFVSAIIFAIAMIGPLTPSHGQPSLIAWFLFSILPLLEFRWTNCGETWPVKIALSAEGIWILLVRIDLLHVRRVF
jgi:hypothetical protein